MVFVGLCLFLVGPTVLADKGKSLLMPQIMANNVRIRELHLICMLSRKRKKFKFNVKILPASLLANAGSPKVRQSMANQFVN